MRRRNKNVSPFWGGQKPPRKLFGDLYFRASTCLKKLGLGGWNLQAVSCLNVNWKSPFHAEPRQQAASKQENAPNGVRLESEKQGVKDYGETTPELRGRKKRNIETVCRPQHSPEEQDGPESQPNCHPRCEMSCHSFLMRQPARSLKTVFRPNPNAASCSQSTNPSLNIQPPFRLLQYKNPVLPGGADNAFVDNRPQRGQPRPKRRATRAGGKAKGKLARE